MTMARYGLLGVCLILAACTVGPDYRPAAFGAAGGWFNAGGAGREEPVKTDWWRIFQDPILEGYIETAVAHNHDITAGLANVRRARAMRALEGAGFLPQVDAGLNLSRSDTGADVSAQNLYDAGFDASWELDIFGGNRRAVEAADARLNAARADYESVMLATLSEVARTYYEARGLQKRITILDENSRLLQRTFELIDARFEAGEASAFDRTRARGEYQLTQARIPNLQADWTAAVFRLSVLLGLPPETLMEEMTVARPLPVPPDVVPVGLRADILRKRPDVRAAESELAAAIADIGIETAELFPRFFLTGAAGSRARVFGDIFSASAGAWSLGGLMQWRVFDGGAIRARIEAEKSESVAALAGYERTVLEALADAETALVRYGRELETRSRLEEGLETRRLAVALANELLNAGETDVLAVLDAERELVATEDQLVLSETQSIIRLVALYTALGGGWEIHAAERAARGLPDIGRPESHSSENHFPESPSSL